MAKKAAASQQTEIEKVAEEVVKTAKKKRTRPDCAVNAEEGDNRKYIHHSLRLSDLGHVDLKNTEQVRERIRTYFEICAEDDMKPSVAGLAVALDTDRTYLFDLRTGRRGKNTEVADLLKKAVQLLDLQMVDYMQNGKINPVSGIFLMKNNFGYTDKQEVVITPNNPMGESQDDEELRQKYLESVVE